MTCQLRPIAPLVSKLCFGKNSSRPRQFAIILWVPSFIHVLTSFQKKTKKQIFRKICFFPFRGAELWTESFQLPTSIATINIWGLLNAGIFCSMFRILYPISPLAFWKTAGPHEHKMNHVCLWLDSNERFTKMHWLVCPIKQRETEGCIRRSFSLSQC